MKIIEKMAKKAGDNAGCEGVTIAFLGDSVTQGCFEIYRTGPDTLETVYDKKSSYEMALYEMLCVLFPSVPVNIINAGISGDRALRGVNRVERDVVRHNPDLTVVCYGLNDCRWTETSLDDYVNSLRGIFEQIQRTDSELIFMTPNMMNTKVSYHVTDPFFIDICEDTAKKQNSGLFDKHIDAARELCREMNVTVCDCYAIWKKLYESGVDVTELLSNKVNHPTREMNKLFAVELLRTMFNN